MRRMEQIPIPTEQKPVDTVTMKRSHFYGVLVVFAFTVGLLFGYVLWGRATQTQQVAQAPAAVPVAVEPTEETPLTRYDVPIDGFPSLGPSDAEIVIVEFSDYQ